MAVADRRARERARREQEILDAALELFRGDDWQAVTVEQIAQGAEVGKGTIYKHFDTKDEVYARLAADFHERVLVDLRTTDRPGDVPTRLRSALFTIWKAHLSAGPALRRVLAYCDRRAFLDRLPDRARLRLRELARERDEVIADILEAGAGQRLFPRKSKELLAFGAQSALQGAVRAIAHGEIAREEAESYFAELANFVLAGLMYQARVRDDPGSG